MTLTRQAGSLLLAGLVSLPLSAQATSPPQTQQPPAPVVRLTPRPPAANRPGPLAGTPAGSATPPTPSGLTTSQAGQRAKAGTTAAVIPRAVPPRPASPQATAPHAATDRAATDHPSSATEHRTVPPSFSTTGLNRNVIVLDPAHGGADSGARIGDNTLEKNVTLSLAFRLRSLLAARGFTVVLTRESDTATEPNSPSTALTLDDRAGIANHARAAACLLLHATGRGTGVHLYSSELEPTPGEASLVPWLTAQSAWVPASQSLAQQLGAALGRSRIALLNSAASVRPLDSLTCPALVVELAPEDEGPNSVNDAGYQERVAAAVAGALVFWKDAVQPPSHLASPAPGTHPTHHTSAAHPQSTSPEAQP